MARGSPLVPIGALISAKTSSPLQCRQRKTRWGKGLVLFQNSLWVQNQCTPLARQIAGTPLLKPKLSGSQARACSQPGNCCWL